MKTAFFVVFAGLLLVSGAPSYGQLAPPKPGAAAAATTAALNTLYSAPDVVLPHLFEAAINNSAEVKQLEAGYQIAGEDLKLARKKPLNMLFLNSNYSYGTLPFFGSSTDPGRQFQFNPFAQGARAQYSAGVSFVAPLDVLLSRRPTLRRQELLVSKAEAERHQKQSEIRQLVIVRYQELLLARTALQHYQDALQSANVSKKIAESRFKEGDIQIDEQMASMSLYNKAVLEQEEAKSKFQTSQMLLEELIGMPISKFIVMLKK